MKFLPILILMVMQVSPPARGAWIEITLRFITKVVLSVAPRTGGVD